MRGSGARLTKRGRGALLAMPLPVVRRAILGRVAQPSTSAPKRTQTYAKPKPEAPASVEPWLANVGMAVVTSGAIVGILTNSISELKSELTANSSALESKLQIELTKLDASNGLLKTELTAKLDANNAKLDTISKDLAALSANVQAQQIQTADMQGQVGVLWAVVTTTPITTKK